MPLTAAELEAMARSPAQASTDAISATARSGEDVKDLLALAAGAALDESANPQGGKRSGWRLLRKGIFSPGGGS